MKTILIFHASKTPNSNGDLNWHEFRSVKKISLSVLQKIVEGDITLIPHRTPDQYKFVAYANESGLLIDTLGRNDLAGMVLSSVGFTGMEFMGMAFAGNVVLTKINDDGDEIGLTQSDVQTWEDLIEKSRKKWNAM